MICLTFLRPAVDTYRVSTNHEDEEATIESLAEMICNKVIEIATESIPGCVFQLCVWFINTDDAGSLALVSIGISALTTGYASAMIAFDKDVDVASRKNQPKFYGYIPDDNYSRGRCFALMTIISALHNVSRSIGCALLAASSGKNLVLLFVGGEMALYMAYKIAGGDFFYWPRLEGTVAIIVGVVTRLVAKIVVDFCGCIHLRHSYELGGLAFSASMIWAQAFPFVALQLYDGTSKDTISTFLVGSFSLWLLLNVAFFATIDLSFIGTFFTTTTAPQYTCQIFLEGTEDAEKFSTVFETRISYMKAVHSDVKEWVATNIVRWKEERKPWFHVELITDELLPIDAFEAEGGFDRKRRRSTYKMTKKTYSR